MGSLLLAPGFHLSSLFSWPLQITASLISEAPRDLSVIFFQGPESKQASKPAPDQSQVKTRKAKSTGEKKAKQPHAAHTSLSQELTANLTFIISVAFSLSLGLIFSREDQVEHEQQKT